MKIGILAITEGGKAMAETLAASLPGAVVLSGRHGVATVFSTHWQELDAFVCIMAAGIVVRSIAPLLEDKKTDPAVVVMNENGQFVVSLLSGHLGGANALAEKVAHLTDGKAVITTASDTLGLPALDLWAKEQHLFVESRQDLVRASAKLVNTGRVKIYSDFPVASLPDAFVGVSDIKDADIIVSDKCITSSEAVVFRPQSLVVGVGCNRGTPLNDFTDAICELFEEHCLAVASVGKLASIDAKSDEKGLLEFAAKNGWRVEFFSKDEINRVSNVDVSQAALKAVGAIGVAEPAALLSAKNNELLVRKRKWQNVTMAVVRVNYTLSEQGQDRLNI